MIIKTEKQRAASRQNVKRATAGAIAKWEALKDDFDGRFWKYVDKSNGPDSCWRWQRSVGGPGYGQVVLNKKVLTCHRLAFTLTFGPIPKGHAICHHCDNKSCCNPRHLFLGTTKDNVRDCIQKGRFKFLPKGEKAYGARLTEDRVKEIRALYGNGGYTYRGISKMYGVAKTTIQGVIERTTWNHIR